MSQNQWDLEIIVFVARIVRNNIVMERVLLGVRLVQKAGAQKVRFVELILHTQCHVKRATDALMIVLVLGQFSVGLAVQCSKRHTAAAVSNNAQLS